MSRKIDFQVSHSFRHAENRTCQVRLNASLALFSARTETHTQVRLPQVLHSIRHAQKRICHVRLTDVRTLFSTLRKRTCQVRLTTTLVLYLARTKRICQVATILALYSARTQNAHVKQG